jgi:hypothetical protein
MLDKPLVPNTLRRVKSFFFLLLAGSLIALRTEAQTNIASAATGASVETIVLIRHAEKPRGGLGQLTVRGLNRALALPDVLLPRYGKPDFVFAPNPTQKVDVGQYYYVRPLTTIEPTAIRCELPVNTQFGFREIAGLEDELKKSKYRSATVFIAWEHALEDEFAKRLVKDNGGDPKQVPAWSNSDYDSIFLFKIARLHGTNSVVFNVEHEGLNNLSDDYPAPAAVGGPAKL